VEYSSIVLINDNFGAISSVKSHSFLLTHYMKQTLILHNKLNVYSNKWTWLPASVNL